MLISQPMQNRTQSNQLLERQVIVLSGTAQYGMQRIAEFTVEWITLQATIWFHLADNLFDYPETLNQRFKGFSNPLRPERRTCSTSTVPAAITFVHHHELGICSVKMLTCSNVSARAWTSQGFPYNACILVCDFVPVNDIGQFHLWMPQIVHVRQ